MLDKIEKFVNTIFIITFIIISLIILRHCAVNIVETGVRNAIEHSKGDPV